MSRGCPSGKRGRYETWSTAVAAAIRVSRHVGPVRCYLCPDCERWHLTTRRRWIERTA